MECIYILLLFFAELSWGVLDAAHVNFQVNNLDEDHVICNDNKTKSITVLEDGIIKIDILLYKDRSINSIKCFKQNDPSELYLYDNKADTQILGLSYQVQMPVKLDMGTVKCTIVIAKEASRESPVDNSSDNLYPAQCFIKVHVRAKKTYQTILVNNMILPTTRNTELEDDSFDHQAIYYYAVKDAVKVSCIILEDSDTFNIFLQYDYAEKLDGSYKNILQKANSLGYGFSTTLQSEHNESVMICTCKGLYDTSTIKVTFIQKEFNDAGYIEVNGHIARQGFEETPNKLIKYFYVFKTYQDITLACRSNKTHLSVGNTCTNPVYDNKQVFEEKFMVTSTSLNFICDLCNERNFVKSFEINVAALPLKIEEYLPPAMQQLPTTNIVLQLHDYKYSNTWIHYVYEDGENVTLKCCQSVRYGKCYAIHNITFDNELIGKRGEKKNDEVTLTSAHDGHIFTCNSTYDGSLKQLTVKFSKKKPITDSTSFGNGIPAPSLVAGVAGALICIILLCITIVIYKRYYQRATISKCRNKNEQILHSNDNFNSINSKHDDTYVNLLRTQNLASKNNKKAANSIQDDPYAKVSKLQGRTIKNDEIQNDDKIIYSEPDNVEGDTYANLLKLQDKAGGPYANVSQLQGRAGKNDEKAANISQDGSYANLSKLQEKADKNYKAQSNSYSNLSKLQNSADKNDENNVNCGLEDNNQFQVEAEEEPEINYAELNTGPQNLPTPNRKEALYAEARQMYAQVLPKSERNNRNCYDNVFANVRYVNSKDAEYVEPTYCEAFQK